MASASLHVNAGDMSQLVGTALLMWLLAVERIGRPLAVESMVTVAVLLRLLTIEGLRVLLVYTFDDRLCETHIG